MMQSYCGRYWSLSTGLVPTGEAVKILFDLGVPVRYRHVWSHFLGSVEPIVGDWMDAETIADLSTTGVKPDVEDSWKYNYSMDIDYDIPDAVYPVFLARLAEKNRAREEQWEKVMARPTPDWALHGLSEVEQGHLYESQIAPERELYDSDLYDIHGNMRGEE